MFKDLTRSRHRNPPITPWTTEDPRHELFSTNDFTEMGLTLIDNEPEELVDFAREDGCSDSLTVYLGTLSAKNAKSGSCKN